MDRLLQIIGQFEWPGLADVLLWRRRPLFALLVLGSLVWIVRRWLAVGRRRRRQEQRDRMLRGKLALITGASSGLGEALAAQLFAAGSRVVLAARRVDQLERVRDQLLRTVPAPPGTPAPIVLQLDLADPDAIPAKIAELQRQHGPVDHLLNNGGLSVRSDVRSCTVAVHQRLMAVNHFGAVALTLAVLPAMLEAPADVRRSITFVSSVSGLVAIPFRSAYAASKHALNAFADSLRAELAGQRAPSVLVVSPGHINTPLSLNALTGSGQRHGRTDAATAAGMPAERCARLIVRAMAERREDVVLAPWTHRMAPVLRACWPSAFFYAMRRRAAKERAANGQ